MSDHFGSIPIEPAAPEPPSTPKIERPQQQRPTQKLRPAKSKKHRTGPGFPKSLMAAILLFFLAAGYLIAGFWGVPRYITTSLPKIFQQHTGILLQLGRVEFSPFSFILKISDITFLEEGNTATPLLALRSFSADIAPLPLFKGEIITTRLLLDTFEANLTRNKEGDYNFFVSSPDGNTSTTIPDFSELPFRFSFNNISLANGKIIFQDKPNNNIHVVEDIQLTLPNLSNFSFQAKEYIHPSFSAIINGSPIQLTGQAALTGNSKDTDVGLRTDLSCNFNAIDLNRYFDYLPFGLPFDISNGKAEGTLKLTFAQSETNDMLSVDFSMQATEIALTSSDENFRLQIPSAKFAGSIEPLTGNTHLTSLELHEPTASIAKDFSFSQFKALASLTTAKETGNVAGEDSPEVSIDLFLADNGTIVLTGDPATTERDRWEGIQLTLKNYVNKASASTPSKRATFRLSGEQKDSRATFSWQGYIDEHLLPAGDLNIVNIAAADLFTILGLTDINAQTGSADIETHISFKDYPELDLNSRITAAEGNLTFNDLTLAHNKHIWYSAPATKITGFSKDGMKVSLGSVYLKNSTLNLHTDSLPDIIRRFGAEKRSIAIEALDFSGSLILSDSEKKRPELHFGEISLQAINLSRLESSSERENLTFTARLGKTGEIQAKGKVRLNPFITTLTTGFSGIDGSQLLPWFGNSALITDSTVTMAGKGSFSFPYVSFNGQLLLQEGALSKKNVPYFSWKEIDLKGFRYNSEPLHIGATECTITAPTMSWRYTPEGRHVISGLSSFLNTHFQRPDTSSAKAKALPVLELQKVNIASAGIHLKDNRLAPPWAGEIRNFSGTLENVTSDPAAKPSTYAITGDFNSVPFTVAGVMHPFDLNKHGEAEFTLHDFPLAIFKEFINKQLDIDSSKADVSLSVKTNWENGLIRQDSELVFRNIEPRSATADSALTLALLTGADGHFTLPVASEQPLDATPSPLLTDAISAFKKLMLKTAVSPLLLATGNFSDLIGEEYAEFLPGQILLTDKGQESLARFSNLLSAHPNIGLTVTGVADKVVDAEAMKSDLEQAEELRVAEENLRRSDALQEATEEYLLAAAKKRKAAGKSAAIVEQKIPSELYKRYAPIKPQKVVIDKSMLHSLATERARVIVEFFTNKLSFAPERISVAKKPVIAGEDGNQGNRVLFTVGTYTRP